MQTKQDRNRNGSNSLESLQSRQWKGDEGAHLCEGSGCQTPAGCGRVPVFIGNFHSAGWEEDVFEEC